MTIAAPSNKDRMFEDEYWGDCPECGGQTKGRAIYATGETLIYTDPVWEYTPFEGEVIKIKYAVCERGDWDQYS